MNLIRAGQHVNVRRFAWRAPLQARGEKQKVRWLQNSAEWALAFLFALSLSHDSRPIYMRQLQVQVASVKSRILTLLVRVSVKAPPAGLARYWLGRRLVNKQTKPWLVLCCVELRFCFLGERTEETKLRPNGNMQPSRASSIAQELV